MSRGKLRVLIIDDEIVIRGSLAAFLEDLDVLVWQAASAEKGLDIISKKFFHMAIVDLRLSGMAGDDFILAASKISPKTKFLIHTGSVDYKTSPKLKALGIGPECILSKPLLDLNHLTRLINTLSEEVSDD